MNIKSSILMRVRIAFLAIFVFAIAIVYRIGHIQYLDGDKWREMAQDIGLQYRTVNATRGNIYSDNGSLLATSLPFYRIAMDPTIAKDEVYSNGLDSLAILLSSHFKDRSVSYYRRKINNARESRNQYVQLNRKQINYQEKKLMSSWPIFREGRFKGGVLFEKADRRYLPFSHLGSRTVGYLNEDKRGLVGLEYSFNELLAGKDGKALFQKMSGGQWKPKYDGSEVRSEEGWDIETTLDINLQDVTESALLKHLKLHDADYGCAVVMEVKTGEIKAMSNLGKNNKGNYRERYNYAVAELTDPGSTFKLASMIALMEDKSISLNDEIDTGEGEYEFYDRVMRDHKPGGYGVITVKEAFSKSSNIAVSKMVNDHFGLNPQRYVDYINGMKISQPLGFQMIGEGIPYIKEPTDKSWSGTTLPWMSIGYELQLTPLQTLAFYNAVANDGKLIQPVIVKRARQADLIKKEFGSAVLNKKICSDETLRKVKEMLEEVVETGTASNINDAHYKIAGKTGTARKLENGRYVRKYYTSFAGYFPADNPKYSCIVVIDNPKGYKQYGSDVAAPVFKEVADKIYSRDLEMHDPYPVEFMMEPNVFPVVQAGNFKDLNFLCNEFGISNHIDSEEEWVRAKRNNNSIQWAQNEVEGDKIPNVLGMTLRDAMFILENKGLNVSFYGNGRVQEQSQAIGTKVIRGSTIKIKLG